jgi:hypothetical protein
MQTIIEIICSKGKSVRDIIAGDPSLDDYFLRILSERKAGRQHGWTKVNGTIDGRRGTINIYWDANTANLRCRVINRGTGKPNHLIGDFIDYMLARHKRRVKHISIWSNE